MSRVSFLRDGPGLLAVITAVVASVFLMCYLGIPFLRRLGVSRAAYARELAAARRVEGLGARTDWSNGVVRCVYIRKGEFPSDMADALSGLSGLEAIDQLVDVRSDHAIARLRHLQHLKAISFSGPGIKDTTIECLKDVKGLKHLSLQDTAITDAGLAHFADYASLEYLKIDRGAITDAGVSHLKDLRNLKGLDLRNVALTDAGLTSLESLRSLRTLRLYECKRITARGVQALQQTLRETAVGWDESAIPGDLFGE